MERASLITSSQNPVVKEIRKAVQRGAPTTEGFVIAEGFHLLEEALRSECAIKMVLTAESVYGTIHRHVRGLNRIPVWRVPDSLHQELSSTESSQGVLALVRPPAWELDHLFRGNSLVVVVDGLQDPGNAGAVLRAAEALGATGALFVKGSVSPFNPKAVRSSAGSVFRLPLLAGIDEALASAALEQRRLDVYAAMPGSGRNVHEADLRRRCAFIIGGEARGVSARLRSGATELRIPTIQVESLNAAVAAGILLYEARRQRQIGP